MFTLPVRTTARVRAAALVAVAAAALAACTITPPTSHVTILAPSSPETVANLDAYRSVVAERVAERNPSEILHGTPQAMLRSLVVVAFTVDRSGQLLQSAVYRSNGDDQAEAIALASLRRAAPLPPPPERLLDGNGKVELMEGWLFNDNGKFQLQSEASPQAQTLN
jgi:protein TonB